MRPDSAEEKFHQKTFMETLLWREQNSKCGQYSVSLFQKVSDEVSEKTVEGAGNNVASEKYSNVEKRNNLQKNLEIQRKQCS